MNIMLGFCALLFACSVFVNVYLWKRQPTLMVSVVPALIEDGESDMTPRIQRSLDASHSITVKKENGFSTVTIPGDGYQVKVEMQIGGLPFQKEVRLPRGTFAMRSPVQLRGDPLVGEK